MSKLYVVELYKETVVVADSEEEAYRLATKDASDIIYRDGADAWVLYEVVSAQDLPEDWDRGRIPWGGDSKNTVQFYL